MIIVRRFRPETDLHLSHLNLIEDDHNDLNSLHQRANLMKAKGEILPSFYFSHFGSNGSKFYLVTFQRKPSCKQLRLREMGLIETSFNHPSIS